MGLQKHDVVDYFDNRKISCGLVIEFDNKKVRVLSEQGKETKISRNRVLDAVKYPGFPVHGAVDEQVGSLRQISGERNRIKQTIDLGELWEVVGPETGRMGVDDLSELFFGNSVDSNCSASLLRAIFEDRIYFKIRPDGIEVSAPERVEQALVQKEKEEERRAFVSASAEFLDKVVKGEDVSPDRAPNGLIELLEESACFAKDWQSFRTAKDLFEQVGASPAWDPFRVLVKLGVWSEDENITLRAEKIPVEFDEETEALAAEAARRPLPADVTDLTGEHVIAIDAVTTRDVDDALSLTRDNGIVTVGVHIADAAHFIDHDSRLDQAIRERATSIYLPEQTIPMMPAVLSEGAASLNQGEDRPALTMLVRLSETGELIDSRLMRSIVRVRERLSYETADERVEDPTSLEAQLYRVAEGLRARRAAAGAVLFKDPELTVKVEEDGAIDVAVRDRETPSQILVSEMMILANTLFAAFLRENDIPAIYRSQPPPSEPIELDDEYDPVKSYAAKRLLVRGEVGTDPAPHSTLGVEQYTTATSPLRRYWDLVIHRQIKMFLTEGRPLLNRSELDNLLVHVSYPVERALNLERERKRYFALRYLEGRKGEEFEVVALYRFPRFHLVQIVELGLNAALNTPDNLHMRPYDRALARIDKLSPRDDRLILSLVKLVEDNGR